MKVIQKIPEGGWAAEGEEPHGLFPPGACVFSGDIDGPFIDTGYQVRETAPYGYVHVTVAEEMGRTVGMRPRADFERLAEKCAAMGEEILELRRKVDALGSFAEVMA